MPTAHVNGVELTYDRHGHGEPVVLVHGSWSDRHAWDRLTPLLVDRHEVIAVDRRAASGTRADDVADLVALIAQLDAQPVHLVGNSFGAAVALHTAATHPSLLASVSAHEPPLFDILGLDAPSDAGALSASVAAVLRLIEAGADDEAARVFVETVAFGPGTWEQLPGELRQTFVRNAPTFLDEQSDPDWASVDLRALAASPVPIQLSWGQGSRRAFRAVIDLLAARIPHAMAVELPGAGHVPHVTHPEVLAGTLGRFFATHPINPEQEVPQPLHDSTPGRPAQREALLGLLCLESYPGWIPR
jgi:pimeloyl-ACP methyl ester carboxylesterase